MSNRRNNLASFLPRMADKRITSKLYSALRVGTSMFHMRVGQLIINAVEDDDRNDIGVDSLFYMEDDELADTINAYINKHNVHTDSTEQGNGMVKQRRKGKTKEQLETMQGLYINGTRPKSKAEVRRAIESNENIRVEATSMFGNEFDGDIYQAPDGKYHFVGPDPYTKRNFYGTITVKRNDENVPVIKVV